MQPQMELIASPETRIQVSDPAQTVAVRWNPALKVGFRFIFSYFVLNSFPFPLDYIPYSGKPLEWYENAWHKIVPWVSTHVLHIAQRITVFPNGSGDTLYNYVLAFCFLVLAAIATVAWSAVDRKRESYAALHRWLRLYARLVLGSALLSYGAYKVIPSQFPLPPQWRFLQSYGDSSPMGILWTFMGVSKSYTIFAGAVEMLGGALLFIPRLTTLGALVAIGAMTNVFVLNMSYDVPVKLYSFYLLTLGVFLVLPELRRLVRFFVLNQPTDPAPVEFRFERRWLQLCFVIGVVAFGMYSAGTSLYYSRKQLKDIRQLYSVAPPLFGVWGVDEFQLDGQLRPPLLTDGARWQKAIFEYKTGVTVLAMDGKLVRF
ncbi:MAG TPA: hypothetical protein VFT65_13965, partial [Candidatus Angelobacter sp.]|nr:hypothetical protein [Candidatus Angelobacter sp.]